jgi:CTP synthase
MDEMSLGKLASWEQYIYPPVRDDPLLGDILRLKDGDESTAESFFVVLTPSCDMAAPGGRKPKVDQVLVAGCCCPKQGILGTGLCKLGKDELGKTLTSTMLTQGYYQKIVPFPSLKGKIPPMMADLKQLKQIPLSEIVPAGSAKYERVASLDSPFRELISWAYMQTACRPGLPERDCDAWNKEIMDAYGA